MRPATKKIEMKYIDADKLIAEIERRKGLKYVHELQHAFRLFKLEKDIVL